MFTSIHLELGNRKNSITAILSAGDVCVDISIGFGHNYYLDLPFGPKRDFDERAIVLKPSLNLSYRHYIEEQPHNMNYLGSIDNDSNTVHLLGYTSGPSFNYTSGKTSYTEQTKTLDLYYLQNELALVPKLCLARNPYKHNLCWEVSISYNLPFYETGGIKIRQDDWQALNSTAVKLNASNLTVSVNQKKISSVPYNFSGFIVSATIGLSVSSKCPLHRKR